MSVEANDLARWLVESRHLNEAQKVINYITDLMEDNEKLVFIARQVNSHRIEVRVPYDGAISIEAIKDIIEFFEVLGYDGIGIFDAVAGVTMISFGVNIETETPGVKRRKAKRKKKLK